MSIEKYTVKTGETMYRLKQYLGIDPSTGKSIRVTRQGFRSKREAERASKKLIAEFENQNFVKNSHNMTFCEVYEEWISIYKDSVKESTYSKTLETFRNHILPEFGGYKINRISVTQYYKSLSKWSKKIKNFMSIHTYARKVFRYALKSKYINSDPTDVPTFPKSKIGSDKPKYTHYSKNELIHFLEGAKKVENTHWFTYFRLLAYSGCRKGELLALTWKDINFNEHYVDISKTVTTGLNNKLIIQTAKTSKSNRLVYMDTETMEILSTWKKEQSELLKLSSLTFSDSQLLFPNEYNSYIYPQKVGQKLQSICSRINLRYISPHWFRHTHVSLLNEASTDYKEISERVGHSNIKQTMNTYAHVSPQKLLETAKTFSDFINSVEPNQ